MFARAETGARSVSHAEPRPNEPASNLLPETIFDQDAPKLPEMQPVPNSLFLLPTVFFVLFGGVVAVR
jgi:hypothetical protein